MKFVIRDDDLNYFSTPADIERWYSDIFAQGIPVGFAAIPFVRGVSDVYVGNVPKDEREYPVSGNSTLISYVKSNPSLEILQHGTTHETKDGIFEYARNLPLGETKRGKEELERAFGRPVRVFVPPHDWINSQGVRAVEADHMDIIRGRGAGLRNWLWRWQYALIFLRMLLFRFPQYFSMAPPVYPHVLSFGCHKEACSYRLEDADIFEGLAYAHAKDGIFVVVVHVHSFTDDKKQRLLELIARARELGADFICPSELFV